MSLRPMHADHVAAKPRLRPPTGEPLAVVFLNPRVRVGPQESAASEPLSPPPVYHHHAAHFAAACTLAHHSLCVNAWLHTMQAMNPSSRIKDKNNHITRTRNCIVPIAHVNSIMAYPMVGHTVHRLVHIASASSTHTV